MTQYKNLEDYDIIGNLETCALVSNDGSIDWCCFPHLESESVFAAILDTEQGGSFSVQPVEPFDSSQQYLDATNILGTEFKTSAGKIDVLDFMPVVEDSGEDGGFHRALYKPITCKEGSVSLRIRFCPRFNFARDETSLKITDFGVRAESENGEVLLLYADGNFTIEGDNAHGQCSIKSGETIWISVHYGGSEKPTTEGYATLLESAQNYWKNWSHSCDLSECKFRWPWHDLVVRSGLVLKLLTHQDSGAIFAAPTTSLPEKIGGSRNWDYRFNWLRDASFTLEALHQLGHQEEAYNFLKWFRKISVAVESPERIQPIYSAHGRSDITEYELTHLSSYKNSRLVRIGNGAAEQLQMDIYGELIDALYQMEQTDALLSAEDWQFLKRIIEFVCDHWQQKDSGIWEVRSAPQHFVYSKLMCWVALDRGIQMAEAHGDTDNVDRWKSTRDAIKKTILEKGYNSDIGSFVRVFDSDSLDATALLIPIMGLLPHEDERVLNTIEAIQTHLTTEEGFVYRYTGKDGVPGSEGAFVLCTFWLIQALALSGQIDEAKSLLHKITDYIGPLGLLAEEIDPATGLQLGNFPQAFSHIGLINSVLTLGQMDTT